jgi:hypothetical protein
MREKEARDKEKHHMRAECAKERREVKSEIKDGE